LWAGQGKDRKLDFAVALGSDLFDALQAAIKWRAHGHAVRIGAETTTEIKLTTNEPKISSIHLFGRTVATVDNQTRFALDMFETAANLAPKQSVHAMNRNSTRDPMRWLRGHNLIIKA
jgi:hypothetical protein